MVWKEEGLSNTGTIMSKVIKAENLVSMGTTTGHLDCIL